MMAPTPYQVPLPGKPRVSQTRSIAKGELRRAKLEGRRVRRNWVVAYGALRLTYSSHEAALACALCMRLWGMITPLGLVGMHREVDG
ncbi:hypothetical protein SEA_RANDO14_58 [Mycobacterium phage Rando14]|uniref:Uncharacterized protein n=1 Tax=Mycobacterium phage Rando14 TaxID=2301556 RepID=A0A385D3Y2_9CAUD|nr:hypothetical protein I5G75_gp38 [Mycobacterium phage Rando14]AXQ53078.1 hypothetical protein SEA_RANDO14_58 [Mycobacterium phage Rando14]